MASRATGSSTKYRPGEPWPGPGTTTFRSNCHGLNAPSGYVVSPTIASASTSVGPSIPSSASQNVFVLVWFLSVTKMNDEDEPMVRPRNVSLAVVRSGAAVAELANNEPATIAKTPTRIPIATSPFCSLQGKPFRLRARAEQCQEREL